MPTDKTFRQSKKMIGATLASLMIFVLVLVSMFRTGADISVVQTAIMTIGGLFATAIGGQSYRESVQARVQPATVESATVEAEPTDAPAVAAPAVSHEMLTEAMVAALSKVASVSVSPPAA